MVKMWTYELACKSFLQDPGATQLKLVSPQTNINKQAILTSTLSMNIIIYIAPLTLHLLKMSLCKGYLKLFRFTVLLWEEQRQFKSLAIFWYPCWNTGLDCVRLWETIEGEHMQPRDTNLCSPCSLYWVSLVHCTGYPLFIERFVPSCSHLIKYCRGCTNQLEIYPLPKNFIIKL